MMILLLRHGESEWNRQDIIQGDADLPGLTARGREQCLRLRSRLPASGVIFSSPRRRASESAALLAPGARVILLESLRERSLGAWEGKRKDELLRQFPQEMARYRETRECPAQGAESCLQVMARASQALADLTARAQGTAIAVSHGNMIRAILACVLGMDFSRTWSIDIANCGLVSLRYEERERYFKLEGIHNPEGAQA